MNDDKQDRDAVGCLIISAVVAAVLILLVGGCASMPGPPAATPALAASGNLPNCIVWCNVVVTAASATADAETDDKLTMGDQTIDLDSTMETSKQTSIDPKP